FGDGVFELGLRQQSLRVGHFGDVRQTVVVPRPRARQGILRGFHLDLRVLGDAAGGIHQRAGARVLRFYRVDHLVVTRRLGGDVVRLGFAAGAQAENV